MKRSDFIRNALELAEEAGVQWESEEPEGWMWHDFSKFAGRNQILPIERKPVLVKLPAQQEKGYPSSVAVGFMKFAAGDLDSPFFVTPGIGGTPVAWCDCLPDGLAGLLWADR